MNLALYPSTLAKVGGRCVCENKEVQHCISCSFVLHRYLELLFMPSTQVPDTADILFSVVSQYGKEINKV